MIKKEELKLSQKANEKVVIFFVRVSYSYIIVSNQSVADSKMDKSV